MSFEKSSNFIDFFSKGEFKAVAMPTFRFRSFVLNLAERQLISGQHTIPLTPKVFDTLAYLVERAGHLAEKEEIMAAVWPDTAVEEGNLARSIHTLRKVFAQVDSDFVYIETVPTKGYRFVAPVAESSEDSDPVPSSAPKALDVATSAADLTPKDLPATDHRPVRYAVLIIAAATLGVFAFTSFDPFTAFTSLKPKTRNGLAYREFQQGKLLLERRLRAEDRAEALAHFERALEADPDYADALAGVADARILTFWDTHNQVEIIKARASVERALAIDSENAFAHTVKCRLLATYDGDLDRAESECRKAIELDQNLAEAHRELGFLLDSVGREAEAVESMRIAASLASTSFNLRSVGIVLYHSRKYEEAIEQFLQVEATDPEYFEVLKWMSWAYEMKGDERNAFNAFIRLLQARGSSPEEVSRMRTVFERDGWKGVLRARLDENEKSSHFIDACDLAQLGEADRAFNVLDQLYQRRAVLSVTVAREPRLDPIRNDPRFAELLKRSFLK